MLVSSVVDFSGLLRITQSVFVWTSCRVLTIYVYDCVFCWFQRFIENYTVSVCMNELLSIEHSEVRTRTQLQAAHALLAAVENCPDAIEVMNDDRETQVGHNKFLLMFSKRMSLSGWILVVIHQVRNCLPRCATSACHQLSIWHEKYGLIHILMQFTHSKISITV